jgi:hypothetical protein
VAAKADVLDVEGQFLARGKDAEVFRVHAPAFANGNFQHA